MVTNPYYSFSGIQDSFYTRIASITNQNKELVDYSFPFNNRQGKSLIVSNITSFSPQEVRSGTGQTITITGTNFGSNSGTVQFKNADNGGASFEDAFDSAIQNWSNTSITVRVPSFAGTGSIQVITDNGDFLETDTELIVLSSELNAEFTQFPGEDYRPKLFNSDRQGGYTWTYTESFYENQDAVAAFERAVDEWVCSTSISWLISDEQLTINGADNDGVNLVTFKSGIENGNDEIGPGTLAVTTTYYLGCENGNTITSYVDEIDMTFNSDFNWFFGEGDPAPNQNDFQGTTTHELGHAHNLGHVIAPTNLMHFETDSGPESATRLIDDDSREGALLSYEFSKTAGLCGEIGVEDRDCGDDTVIEVLNIDGVVVVENPVFDEIDLIVQQIDNLGYGFFLYDLNGRILIDETLTNSDGPVDISFLSDGIYIMRIVVESEVYTKKILKL